MRKGKGVAYVFPGQGSQRVGMGKELYCDFAEARKIFEEADDALGIPLSKICFQGPEARLAQTSIVQPAILAVSIAYLRVTPGIQTLELKRKPSFMAGHSLGEYTALVAAGALDLKQAIRLVCQRGKWMGEAAEQNSGGMVAVFGLDEFTLEEICEETGVEIANINSPDQIVISGFKERLAWAGDLARARGARIIPLKVVGAFHSRLMEPVVGRMDKALSQVPFSEPEYTIVANTTAKPITTSEEIREELVKQICGRVLWEKSVEYMTGKGVSTFIEIGPGRALSGLIQKINPEANIINVGFGG